MNRKHGYLKKGAKVPPEYAAWNAAKSRCRWKPNSSYKHYGARGITMCEEWKNSFEVFLAYVGPRPPNTSLDRINNEKGYEPGNVRWATISEQNFNRRNPKYSSDDHLKWRELRQKGMKFREIAERYNCPVSTIASGLDCLKRRGL